MFRRCEDRSTPVIAESDFEGYARGIEQVKTSPPLFFASKGWDRFSPVTDNGVMLGECAIHGRLEVERASPRFHERYYADLQAGRWSIL